MTDLKAIQARSLEMAEYFVAFVKNMICSVISVAEALLVPFETRDLFLGTTTQTFMPRKDYEKLAELWPRYADERYFLSKSHKDFVDRNLLLPFVTRKPPVSSLISRIWICHMVWPWMFCLWIIIRKIQLSGKQVRWALIYSLFCAQTIPEKHGALMKWGSRILLGLTQNLCYRIWKKKLRKK